MYWLLPGLRRIISVGHVYWHDVSWWCMLVPRLCRYTSGTIHLDVCSHLRYVAFGVDKSYVVKHIRTKTVSFFWSIYCVLYVGTNLSVPVCLTVQMIIAFKMTSIGTMYARKNYYVLTDTAMLISELTRFDSFYIFSTELLVFLLCRQTDKEFRLIWPSFVRVEIYHKYQLSINRKYRLPESWIFHSEVVRALALDPGVMSSSPGLYLFFLINDCFYFPVFPFFSQFRSKTVGIYIASTTIPDLQWKRSQVFFYFFKVANTPRNGTIRHIAWLHLSSFLFKIQCFYRDKNNLDPDDQH